jgi:calcineurin-like phosphoesterase family protein
LNVGTLKNREEELVNLMEERKLGLFGVSETREKITARRELHNNYICYSSSVGTGRHGVAIIVSPNMAHHVEKFIPIDNRIVILMLKIRLKKIIVAQTYAPQQGRPEDEKEAFFLKLQDEIDKIRTVEEVIIMGDLNGHVGKSRIGFEDVIGHHGVGCMNEEGNRIVDFCKQNHLKIMNTYYEHRDSHKYTWYGWNSNKQEYDKMTQIDLFLTTDYRSVTNVKAIPSVSLDSDHRLVVMKTIYRSQKNRPAEKRRRVNTRALKDQEIRTKFLTQLQNTANTMNQADDVETMWKIFKENLENNLNETVGFQWSSVSKKRKTPWWSEAVSEKVRAKQKAFRDWMKHRTSLNRGLYIEARREAEKAIKKSKKMKWEQLCDDIEKDIVGTKKLLYQLAKSYRKGQQQKPYNIKDEEENIIMETGQVKERWTDYFSQLLNVDQEADSTEEIFDQVDNIYKITQEEVRWAIKKSKNNKAPGPDTIPNEVYKAGEDIMVEQLTDLFNAAYINGQVPEEWCQSDIVPIYKQKGDYLCCKNYRGVSLMSHASKLYESVLEARLREVVEPKMGKWQHGFRPGKSTTDMIWGLRNMVEKHWEFNAPLFVAFLDLEKAFDRVPRSRLWRVLLEYGVEADLQRAIKSTYMTSQSRVTTNVGAGEWFKTESGVRQGSILSPLLFIMYMDLVIRKVSELNSDEGMILAYADDIAQTATSEQQLQKQMNNWCLVFKEFKLKLNVQKTEVLLVSRIPRKVNIVVENSELKQTERFKYLGSIVSDNARREEEIYTRISNYSKHVGLLYPLLKDKSVPRKAKRLIYLTILRPLLIYGHESWVLTKSIESKIQAAEMKVLRLIRGVNIMDKMRNETIRKELDIQSILTTVKNSQLRWFGHVMRRDDSSLVKNILDYKVKGKRPTGRPRRTYLRHINLLLKDRSTTLDEVISLKTYDNRPAWKSLCQGQESIS